MIEQFVSDLQFENQCYAVIISSPVSSGTLSAVHVPPLPEGYAFYDAAHIPAQKTIDIFENPVPVFAEDTIAYKGQAVGILTGTDRSILEALRKEVRVAINPIPVDGSEEQRTHDFFNYPVIAKDIRTAGNTEAIFETAQSVTYSSLKINSQYPARAEPFSVTTVFREDGLDIYTPTQWPFHIRSAVAKTVGTAEENIVVYPTQIGETFNELLWYPSLLACRCAVAAVRQKRTVSLSLSAEESLIAAPKTPEVTIQCKSELSDKQSIRAIHIFITVNAGSLCPLIDRILKQMTASALGPYRISNYRIEAVALKTPRGLTDIFEGWGDSFTSNAIENHICTLIQAHNLSPDEWRLANLRGEYSSVFSNLFEAVIQNSNFLRKYAAYHVFNRAKKDKRDGRWRGIGLAAGLQYSGCAADFTYTVEMDLDIHNRLSIKAEPASENLKKIIRKLAAKKLEIAETDIHFTGLTTADMNFSAPATAGYMFSIMLPLIEQCITDLQEQLFRNPLPISISRSYRAPQPKADSLTERDSAVAFISKTPAACIVELELLPACYEIIIRAIWFACSPGKVYDRKQMMSYLRKNITTALSRTCKESLQYTASGDIIVPNSEYRMILPNELPPFSVYILERHSPMSAVNSCAENVLPAAYLAALNQILLSIPARIDTLPVLTADIFNVLTESHKHENTISTE